MLYTKCSPNNCAIIHDNVIVLIDKVDKKAGQPVVHGFRLIFSRSLYDYPYPSKVLLIGWYSTSRQHVSGEAVRKCFVFPVDIDYLIIPFSSM